MAARLLMIVAAAVTPALSMSSIEERFERLEARVRALEEQNAQLQAGRPLDAPTAAAKVAAGVSARGEVGGGMGRRLSEPTCCRWTPSDECGSDTTEGCSMLHEYLETKTTTHEFAAVETCLGGTDHSNFKASFHGMDGNVSLSYGNSQVTSFKTPLKVTHAVNCGNVPPTLTVQMDTTIGSLSVGALSATTASVGGVPLVTWRLGLVFELLEGFPGAAEDKDVTYNSADSSFAFDASDQGYVRVIKPVDKDFTIYFEVKTTLNTLDTGDCASTFSTASPNICQGANGGGWWEGVGLVDSEKMNPQHDFGVSIAAGRIMFGVGHPTNTALTLFSTTSVSDGAWHTVRASRSIGGMMRLYIDGTLEASHLNTGQVGLLESTSNILIGAILNEADGDSTFTPLNYFTGSLSDVRIYDSFS